MHVVAEWLTTSTATAAGAAAAAGAATTATTTTAAANASAAVRQALDIKVIEGIRPQAIAFNGGEMASYEVDFQAGYRVLMYPNANQFAAEHLALLNSQKQARPFLDYALDALCFPPHELMHCVQMELKQKDDGGLCM
jgi:hypothetical protein